MGTFEKQQGILVSVIDKAIVSIWWVFLMRFRACWQERSIQPKASHRLHILGMVSGKLTSRDTKRSTFV